MTNPPKRPVAISGRLVCSCKKFRLSGFCTHIQDEILANRDVIHDPETKRDLGLLMPGAKGPVWVPIFAAVRIPLRQHDFFFEVPVRLDEMDSNRVRKAFITKMRDPDSHGQFLCFVGPSDGRRALRHEILSRLMAIRDECGELGCSSSYEHKELKQSFEGRAGLVETYYRYYNGTCLHCFEIDGALADSAVATR